MKAFLKHIGLFALAVLAALIVAPVFANIYQAIAHKSLGSFLDFSYFVGLLFAVPAFISLLFELFGGEFRRIIIIALSIPFIIFSFLSNDWISVAFLLALIVIFFGLGWLLRRF